MSSVAAPVRIPAARAYPAARRLSVTGMVGVVAVHAGLLILMASLQVLPLTLPLPLATQLVQIITPTSLTPSAPDITPPRPLPVERKPVFHPKPALPLPQTLAVPTEAPSAAAEVPQMMQAPAAAPADPVPAAPVAPETATVTPARFDADYLQNPPPAYPALSRRIGEEGTVVLRVFVETTGRPSQIEVKSASGSPRLDQAAQDAVWRWKFVSARRGMDAVGAWVLVPIVFSLRG